MQQAELDPFETQAKRERKDAAKAIPNVRSVLAAIGVTAIACRKLGRSGPLCVTSLGSKSARQTAAAMLAS